jgi:hypothetical protein
MHSAGGREMEGCEYLHLVHPDPVPWNVLFESIAQELTCTLVPFADWLGKLQEAAEDPAELADNPAIKLVDFYWHVASSAAARLAEPPDAEQHPQREAMGLPCFQTNQARARSRIVRNLPRLGSDDVLKWVDYWRSHGFLA